MTQALAGYRLLDFTWLMAGAFGPKYLAAYGAEVIRIEWRDKIDFLRYSAPFIVPPGEEGDPMTRPNSLNRSSFFNDINAGKRGITLNLHDRRGKELFARLLRLSDGVMDNFTPTTLARWGFSYEQMRAIQPDIVYVQSAGFGAYGPYSPFRSYGSIGQGASGLTYMAGLPDRGPCGWGYSYMDVTAGWYVALNTMAALRHRSKTGRGHHLDTAQTDAAVYHTGTAILDYSANGRHYVRSGNRSPHVIAAPHGAYRCADDPEWRNMASDDHWIAITCFTEEHWRGLVAEMGDPAWAQDPKFATLEARYANQDELDRRVEAWTRTQERYSLMERLQARGVPAGVCQDTRDRIDRDPQLAHLNFFRIVPHSEVGSYRLQGIPGRFSLTPPDVGGVHGRGAPCFGEDNEYVFGEILGLSTREMAELHAADIIEMPAQKIVYAGPHPPDPPSLQGRGELPSGAAASPESPRGVDDRSSTGLPLAFREGGQGVRSDAAFSDLRVLEIGDANGEFAGKLLAMNGAEVVRIEPPGGGPARRIGPFYEGGLAEACGDPEKSLYHWHYNAGKKGITLDIETEEGRAIFRDLVKDADLLIESHPPGYLKERGLGYEALSRLNPGLIVISITAFGSDGPWRDYVGSDLVHMALGGEMMMCGYDRNAEGVYDTPPIAPQMWHSRHVTGNLAFMHAMAAIMYRDRTGQGQHIKLSVHEACANATEWGLPNALTGVPAQGRRITIPLLLAGDGKYVVVHPPTFPGEWDKHVAFLRQYSAQGDLDEPMWQDETVRRSPEGRAHLAEVTARFIAEHDSEEVWVEAQKHDVIWVAVRAPEDNLANEHFRLRGITGEVAHPDLGRSFGYPTAPRAQTDLPWLKEPRAPHLGEHNAEVLGRAGVTAERLAELRRKQII